MASIRGSPGEVMSLVVNTTCIMSVVGTPVAASFERHLGSDRTPSPNSQPAFRRLRLRLANPVMDSTDARSNTHTRQ